jgi:hypothetical protein
VNIVDACGVSANIFITFVVSTNNAVAATVNIVSNYVFHNAFITILILL